MCSAVGSLEKTRMDKGLHVVRHVYTVNIIAVTFLSLTMRIARGSRTQVERGCWHEVSRTG